MVISAKRAMQKRFFVEREIGGGFFGCQHGDLSARRGAALSAASRPPLRNFRTLRPQRNIATAMRSIVFALSTSRGGCRSVLCALRVGIDVLAPTSTGRFF